MSISHQENNIMSTSHQDNDIISPAQLLTRDKKYFENCSS